MKSTLKDTLVGYLGVFGVIIFYLVLITIVFLPLNVLRLPWWADILIYLGVYFLRNYIIIPLWIWGLIVAFGMPLSVTTVLMFIVAGISVITFVFRIIFNRGS